GGGGSVRVAQDDRGAGVWTDQTGARIPAVSLARAGQGARRVGADLHDTQYSEASQDLLWIAPPLLVERVAEAAHRSALPVQNTSRKRLRLQTSTSAATLITNEPPRDSRMLNLGQAPRGTIVSAWRVCCTDFHPFSPRLERTMPERHGYRAVAWGGLDYALAGQKEP